MAAALAGYRSTWRPSLIDGYVLRSLARPAVGVLGVTLIAFLLEQTLRLIRELSANGAHLGFLPGLITNLVPYHLGLALPRHLDAKELIEDELLLALPLVPRHDQCPEPLGTPAEEPPLAAVDALVSLPELVDDESSSLEPHAAAPNASVPASASAMKLRDDLMVGSVLLFVHPDGCPKGASRAR